MSKIFVSVRKYGAVPALAMGVSSLGAMPVFASEAGGAATISGTLDIFGQVFAWFLEQGGELLTWMLDKPIILLSLAIFFVGAVVGVLSRIYNAF